VNKTAFPDDARRRLLQYLLGGSLAWLFPSFVCADNIRHGSALLIGNANYAAAPLLNPAHDANAMQAALKQLGFATQIETDADHARMLDQLRIYLRRAETSDVRLIFYAGHGVQWQGRNYLIPVDANIHTEAELIACSVDLGAVIDRLSALRDGVNIVIIDACRNNPFVPSVGKLATTRRLHTRSPGSVRDGAGNGGLARVDAPSGTVIAFSTAPGSVSADNPEEKNSLYTALLVERLATPGLSVERLFKEVRIEVARRTGQRQVPWENSSLMGEFCFRHDSAGRCNP
jgi:uncharacterized caspase-like protein